jgi:hypothetical protein
VVWVRSHNGRVVDTTKYTLDHIDGDHYNHTRGNLQLE